MGHGDSRRGDRAVGYKDDDIWGQRAWEQGSGARG